MLVPGFLKLTSCHWPDGHVISPPPEWWQKRGALGGGFSTPTGGMASLLMTEIEINALVLVDINCESGSPQAAG